VRLIKLYGDLAKAAGQRSFLAAVDSVAEAVSFLLANFPHLEKHIINHNYRVKVGKRIATEDDLTFTLNNADTISIIPVIAGAGAVWRIIAGTLLIAASFLIPGVALFGLALAPIAFGIGASLVLGGVAQLLSPVPQTNIAEDKDPKKTYSFSGIQNTSRQGLPVPVIYGETIVGSITISAGISTDTEISAATSTFTPNPNSGGGGKF
jgi:predicted phage tail protein